ncbi:ester cyclase [Ahrensia kielensis]|uniref:Ester cyclase n=1 Tax=Ahrensia kielensis TaxID=76980 RepID=A0ABU9TA63_9HYPH
MLAIKQKFYQSLAKLADVSINDTQALLTNIAHENAQWRVAHPMNEMEGNSAALATVFLPLKAALPDLERRDLIFVGGEYEGRQYIATIGHYCGTFKNNWLTIPANGQSMHLRYGEIYEIKDGKIIQANLLWDVLDFIRQAGFWPIAPSCGAEGMWFGPRTADGIVLHETSAALSEASIAQTLAMHKTLFDFDQMTPTRDGLLTMPQQTFWHPKMMWYGPSGIGTARGLLGFIDKHQLPFRSAFQRPKGTPEQIADEKAKYKAGHYIRIGDGDYSVTGGWPSVCALHYGGGFAGMPPTGRNVTMRVMDFYHHHQGLIRENWVPLDMLDLLNQMGLDVMDRLHDQFQRGQYNN